MKITVNRIDAQDVNGNGSDVINTYAVVENDREFIITCRSNQFGRSLGLLGKEGTLFINREDKKVYLQKVALGGGCGLLIDDDPVEGLSPWAIRGVILAEQKNEMREITMTTEQSDDNASQPLLLIDGLIQGLSQ
jgi:hypothetical protein